MTKESSLFSYIFVSAVIHGIALGGMSGLFSEDAKIDFAHDVTSVSIRLSGAPVDPPLEQPVEPEASTPELIEPDLSPVTLERSIPKIPRKRIKPIKRIPRPSPPTPTPAHHKTAGGMGEAHASPQLISAPKPPYPRRARRMGFEGTVVLHASIAATGKVTNVDILRSSGRSDCDQSAQRTILHHWKFQPATLFGKSVEAKEKIEVTFTLHEGGLR